MGALLSAEWCVQAVLPRARGRRVHGWGTGNTGRRRRPTGTESERQTDGHTDRDGGDEEGQRGRWGERRWGQRQGPGFTRKTEMCADSPLHALECPQSVANVEVAEGTGRLCDCPLPPQQDRRPPLRRGEKRKVRRGLGLQSPGCLLGRPLPCEDPTNPAPTPLRDPGSRAWCSVPPPTPPDGQLILGCSGPTGLGTVRAGRGRERELTLSGDISRGGPTVW